MDTCLVIILILHATLIRGSIKVCQTSSILPSINEYKTSLHNLRDLGTVQIFLFSNVFNIHATCFNIRGSIKVSQTLFYFRMIKKRLHLLCNCC